MALLELETKHPDWLGALQVALIRPEGVPERRSGEDPWNPPADVERPRRISDDLAWLRQAMDEPEAYGLTPVEADLQHVWDARQTPEAVERLDRLEQRGILRAAGFVLHAADGEAV